MPQGPRQNEAYTLATRAFSIAIAGSGIAMMVVTLANGGGPGSIGFLLGFAFVGLGIARLYLAMRGGA